MMTKQLMFWVGTVAPLVTFFMGLLLPSVGAVDTQRVRENGQVGIDTQTTALLPIALPQYLSEIEPPVTTGSEELTQIAQASVVQITAVQLDATDGKIELILQTTDELAIPETSVTGNVLIADIPNTVLVLADGAQFSAAEPVPGIALVNITNLPNNRVRVAIAGTNVPPTVEVRSQATGLALSVNPGTETEAATDEDVIEVVVTGEQTDDDYFVPDAGTATRTDTPIIDTPQSIQVIPQQILEDQQIIRIDDAFRNVSGVTGSTVNSFGAAANAVTIRGFRADSGLPILRDGFRDYDNFSSPETANLEQIEVLKGPASILYGQLDPGGIINLVTKQPLSQPFYELEFQAGSYGLIRPSLDISGPLTSDGNLLYRLNAVYQRENGFRDYETNQERFFIAPTVRWNISDRTDLTVSLEYLAQRLPADTGLVAFGGEVADVPDDRIFNEPDDFSKSNYLNVGYNLEHRFNDNWRLRNAFRYLQQEFFTQVALPLFIEPTTGILDRFYNERNLQSDNYSLQTNVVGEFATGSVNHTLLAGVDLNWNSRDELTTGDLESIVPIDIFNPVYGAFPRPDTLPPIEGFDTNGEISRVGAYLQDQVSFGDRVILLAGLRYDSVDYSSTDNTSGDVSSNYDDAFTPRVGLIYKPTENVSLYASMRDRLPQTLDRM